MGGSGLQWSFSGQPDSSSQILSFKSSSEGGNHSIYAPGFVQKPVSVEKITRQIVKTSPLNSKSVGSNPSSSAVVGSTNLSESSFIGPSQMTIFYNGLVCVYDDVAPDKAQAIMLLAGTGNSRSQKGAESMPKIIPPAKSEVVIVKPSSLPADLLQVPEISGREFFSKIEVNARNPGSKFPAPSNQILHSHSALRVDLVSSDANLKKTASTFPTPIAGFAASNQIHFHHSAVPIIRVPDSVSAGASTNTVEITPRNPGFKYPSPATGPTGTNRFRFSSSAINIDPVLAGASISKLDSPNPASKFSTPRTGSPVPSQYRFSQPVPGRASPGRIELPSVKFQPPATGSAGANQIRFSQSGVASTAAIEISTSNFAPPATVSSSQIRFSRSALPVEDGSARAPISIVESNPIKRIAKSPDPATASASNQFRFTQPANPLDPASSGTSNSTSVERNSIKPVTVSGSNQFRFSHTASPITPSNSNQKIQTTKFSDPTAQFCFSQSGTASSFMDRAASSSSSLELAKPVSPASTIDRASSSASNSTVEACPAPAKANQLRFSQSGVPLARKASLARFLEKRKERPPGEVADLPAAKYRSNSG